MLLFGQSDPRRKFAIPFAIIGALLCMAIIVTTAAQAAEQRLRFPGGYVTAPNAPNWKLSSAKKRQSVSRTLGSDHFVFAALESVSTLSNREAFVHLTQPRAVLDMNIRDIRDIKFSESYVRRESFTSTPSNWKGNECTDYQAELEQDGHPGRSWGRMCILKDRKGLFLSLVLLEYGESRPPGATRHEGFEKEAEEFFNSIVTTR